LKNARTHQENSLGHKMDTGFPVINFQTFGANSRLQPTPERLAHIIVPSQSTTGPIIGTNVVMGCARLTSLSNSFYSLTMRSCRLRSLARKGGGSLRQKYGLIVAQSGL